MSDYTILAVEDDEDVLELICVNLRKEGFEAIGAGSGEEALRISRTVVPQLIILDIMLPGINGLDVCRVLKHDNALRHIPIILLTAKGTESDIVTGLGLGADDYITKPFSPKVLIARVQAVLRRQETPAISATAAIKTHDLLIDPDRHKVMVDGVKIDLTLTEFRILHLLARRTGWVFNRYQIVDAVRGEDYSVTERSVDVHVASLRKKLGASGQYLETVRGVGYRLKEE